MDEWNLGLTYTMQLTWFFGFEITFFDSLWPLNRLACKIDELYATCQNLSCKDNACNVAYTTRHALSSLYYFHNTGSANGKTTEKALVDAC